VTSLQWRDVFIASLFNKVPRLSIDMSQYHRCCYLLHYSFLLVLLFDPEDGGGMFLRTVGKFSSRFRPLYPRRHGSIDLRLTFLPRIKACQLTGWRLLFTRRQISVSAPGVLNKTFQWLTSSFRFLVCSTPKWIFWISGSRQWSWDSVVGIVTGYELDGPRVRVRIPVRSRNSFSSQSPDRFWGPLSLLSSSYRDYILRGKAAGTWIVPLTSILYRGKEKWSYTSTPPYTVMAWCLIN
jgi:hypothetical protein